MLRLLLIDDNPDDRLLAAHHLQQEFPDAEVDSVGDLQGFEQALASGHFDLVVTDYRLRWSDGLTILRQIKSRYPICPVVMFTDSGSQEIAVKAMKMGLDDYVLKSTKHLAQLSAAVRTALERRQTKMALQESEERLRLALEAAHMGIWDWDLQTQRVVLTDSHERLFGLAPGTFEETPAAFLEQIYPADRDQVVEALDQAIATHKSYDQEYRVVLPDGQIRWMAGKGQMIFDEAGQAIRLLGTTIDITDRKTAELALQQLNNTLEQQIQERTAQIQQALEFNATLKRITDNARDSLDEEQILQTAVRELASVLAVRGCNAGLYDLQNNVSVIRYEYTTLPSQQGREIPMSSFPVRYEQLLQGVCFQWCPLEPEQGQERMAILACPIRDREGVIGDLWLMHEAQNAFESHDIGLVEQVANQCAIALRQAQLYQAAQAQVQELENLNRLKDDFLSTVSHELRTPVANMKMAIQMLQLAADHPERRQRYLDILRAECDREAELVNDLLDLQQLEIASTQRIIKSAIHLPTWLLNLIEPFQTRMHRHQQVVEIDINPDLPLLLVDQDTLKRVLAELLNNACKYTPADGKIGIYVKACESLSAQSPSIVFEIKNQAEIPPKELPQIFNKFYRVPNADPWKQGGTGLGLALVQQLVGRLRGDIQVESENGWTVFRVELPMGTPV